MRTSTDMVESNNREEVVKEDEDDDYHNAVIGVTGRNDSNNSNNNDSGGGGMRLDGMELQSKLSVPKKQSGLFGASCNLVNSIVGAGIIGIPYAFRQSGLVVGLGLLLLVGYLTDKSLRILVDLASFHPLLVTKDVRCYEDLAGIPFGPFGSRFILFNMFLMAYGAMVAYLLIIKDTIPTLMGIDDDSWNREVIMFVTSLCIMVPLSMQRDMASLAMTSLLSVLADVILVFFVMICAPIQKTIDQEGGFGEVLRKDAVQPTLFIGLGILSTAMACQHSAFIVSGSLANKTRRRWAIVTSSSIGLSTLLCTMLGTAGYLGYGQQTEGDILNNFDDDSTPANAARILLAFTMFFTYPMESLVARHVFIMLFHDGDIDGHSSPSSYFNRRTTATFGIYILTLLPALLVDDIGPVLSITGSIAGGCISYIAPGLIYLGVNSDAFLAFSYSLLWNHNNKHTTTTSAQLPLQGDASQRMPSTNTLPQVGTRIQMTTIIPDDQPKPFWWYLFGFPLWIYVANYASQSMKQKSTDSESYQPHYSPKRNTDTTTTTTTTEHNLDVESMVPTKRDYIMAIFFILFGIISGIIGLISNIYIINKER